MRRNTLRVALVGPARLYAQAIEGLSPSIEPAYFAEGPGSASALVEWGPDLVALLPGAAGVKGTTCRTLDLAEADLRGPSAALEARLLGLGTVSEGRPSSGEDLLGRSLAMARVRGQLEAAARSDLPLLITGENGTGKDLAAQVAHRLSPRAARPWVAVNCGGIPPLLAESEFFGSVRGAFTGAENRLGYCQQAVGGTLFLDEVGELPLELQAKLLRVLENGELRRVGSAKVEKTDFRLICATNRHLPSAVAAGRFREDLFYRIAVLSVTMPPLRDRQDDLAVLAHHFLDAEVLGPHRGRRLHPEALARLREHPWPGNLRQLRNVLYRAVVLQTGPEVRAEHLVWD